MNLKTVQLHKENTEQKNVSLPQQLRYATKACENSDAFRFEDNLEFTCDLYIAKKPKKRCKKKVQGTKDEGTGKLKKVKFFCPATCKKNCKDL